MLCGFSSLWWPFGWNWSYLGFLGIIWRTCGSKCGGEGGGIFPTLCVECCLVISKFMMIWSVQIRLTFLFRIIHVIIIIKLFLAATKQLYEWFSPSARSSVCDIFLAATKQLYEWYFLSVCPSVRLSVCLSVRLSVCPSVCPSVTPFWLCSHHRIIMKFSGVITSDQGKVHAKGQGQRSKVKVTEVTTQIFVSGL